MLTDYIQIFCGSGIDALELKNRLKKEINVKIS